MTHLAHLVALPSGGEIPPALYPPGWLEVQRRSVVVCAYRYVMSPSGYGVDEVLEEVYRRPGFKGEPDPETARPEFIGGRRLVSYREAIS